MVETKGLRKSPFLDFLSSVIGIDKGGFLVGDLGTLPIYPLLFPSLLGDPPPNLNHPESDSHASIPSALGF